MATRSLIGIKNKDGSIETIYNHWDGYPTYVGTVLSLFYGEKETRKLLKFGDRSTLLAKPTKKDSYAERGEKCPARKYNSFAEFAKADKAGAEYVYLLEFDNEQKPPFIGYSNCDWVAYKADYDESITRLGILERSVNFKNSLQAVAV